MAILRKKKIVLLEGMKSLSVGSKSSLREIISKNKNDFAP